MDQFEVEEEARVSLFRLLQLKGIRCSDNDLLVKRAITRSGHPLYVVIGLNGTEKVLSSLTRKVAGRRESSAGAEGVFLLRPGDLLKLIASTSSPA